MPGGHVGMGFPVDEIRTVCFLAAQGLYHLDVYLYDPLAETARHVPVQNQPKTVHYNAIVSPYDFPGEAACKAQAP